MKVSAGILMYRFSGSGPEFFLVHPGGPYFVRKDDGHWTVPKGEFPESEDPLQAAIREFEEETGYRPAGNFIPLEPITQKGGKKVYCWAVEGDLDPASLVSNTFKLEWPPRSGKMQQFPEVDKGDWFPAKQAAVKIKDAQIPLLEQCISLLRSR